MTAAKERSGFESTENGVGQACYVRAPRHLLRTLAAAAEAAYPRECCGLLVGQWDGQTGVQLVRAVASRNLADPGRPDRFEVDPAVRFAVMREAAEGPHTLVGHYHSHPNAPAKPSATDLAMAYEPALIWLITAVRNGRAGETTAWRLEREEGHVCQLALTPLPIEAERPQ